MPELREPGVPGWYDLHDLPSIIPYVVEGAYMLDNWHPTKRIEPEEIDAISGKVVISQPFYAVGEETVHSQLKNLLTQIKLLEHPPARVVIPIHLGNHWVTLCVVPDAGSYTKSRGIDRADVIYINPLGPSTYPEGAQMRERAADLFPKGNVVSNAIAFQEDGLSCGPIMVEVIRALAETDNPVALFRNDDFARTFSSGGTRDPLTRLRPWQLRRSILPDDHPLKVDLAERLRTQIER